MRYHCYFCGKSVTSALPDDSVVRALLVCPECIEAKRVAFPDDDIIVIADEHPQRTGE